MTMLNDLMWTPRFHGPKGKWECGGFKCMFYTEDGVTSFSVARVGSLDPYANLVDFDVSSRDLVESHFSAWVELGRPDRTWIGASRPLFPVEIERLTLVQRHTGMELRFSSPEALAVAARLAGDSPVRKSWKQALLDELD